MKFSGKSKIESLKEREDKLKRFCSRNEEEEEEDRKTSESTGERRKPTP